MSAVYGAAKVGKFCRKLLSNFVQFPCSSIRGHVFLLINAQINGKLLFLSSVSSISVRGEGGGGDISSLFSRVCEWLSLEL